jgi:hypothetical protein
MSKPIDITTPLGCLRVVENDFQKDFEGGRIVLVADNSDPARPSNTPNLDLLSEDMKIQGITVIINYRKNAAMADWPALGGDAEPRRFTLNIKEVPASTAAAAKK